MLSDFRFALRSLFRTPGYSAVIALTLALGIGVGTAIFSFFNGILLRALPHDAPERVVVAKKTPRDFSDPIGTDIGILAADFRELAPQVRSFSELAAYTLDSATLTGRESATLVSAAIVTPNFFTTLGSHAIIGRTFRADVNTSSENRLAVVSYRFWQSRLGGETSAIGRTVTLNRVPFTVVGVMPPDFALPREADLWVTPSADVPEHAIADTRDFAGRGNYLRTIIGRLAPGISVAAAENEVVAALEALPNPNQLQRRIHFVNLRDHTIGNARPALAILLGCVGLVLLIACFNVANLMLARATSRSREIAIRAALGATRSRIARQLLFESLLLALLGGAVGVLLSIWILELLLKIAPDELPRLAMIGIDGPVLAFALLVSLGTGLVSGLVPVLGAGRADLQAAIKSGGRTGSTGAAPRRLRSALVAGEVVISLVLLVAAGLLVRSLARMDAFTWGFRPAQVMSARVAFLDERYGSDEGRWAFYRTLRDRLGAEPAVQSFGTSLDRIGASWINLPYTAQGEVYPNPGDRPVANYHIVSPGYLETMGIPVLEGRAFAPQDNHEAPPRILIDAKLARRHFPEGNAVGRTLTVVTNAGDTVAEIIGVVGAVSFDGPTGAPRPDLYFPFLRSPQNHFFVHFRTPLAPGAAEELLKKVMREIDGDVPVTNFATMDQVMAQPGIARRFPLGLLGGFALLAIVLAAVGIYAVTSYSIGQRTREIGVRMALGATPHSVVALVLRQSFKPVAIGMFVGLAGAAGAALAMRGLLFDIAPFDAPTFACVALLLGAVAAIASFLPARRATRINPVIALGAE